MSSKNLILFVIVISLIILLLGWRQIDTSQDRENVVAVTGLYNASGHADRQSEAFTYWEEDDPPVIPEDCAKCHSTTGMLSFLGEDGSQQGSVEETVPAGNVILCNACHNPSAHALTLVSFHNNAEVETSSTKAICMVCHQTRESTGSIRSELDGLADDEVLVNQAIFTPHYKFAASTRYGTEVEGGYEYPDREYAGFFFHAESANDCTECHDPHNLNVDPQRCSVCHVNVVSEADFRTIRMSETDYDADKDTSEGISQEIVSLSSQLLGAMQAYSSTVVGTPLVFVDQYPYFYTDTNENGEADSDEISDENSYNRWTPRLLRAAYNYLFFLNDPGGFVHNPGYMIQLLHDSLVDITEPLSTEFIDLPRP